MASTDVIKPEESSSCRNGFGCERVTRDGDEREVGPVSLTIVPETDDWGIRPAEWVLTGESCITIDLGLITARVVERVEAAAA